MIGVLYGCHKGIFCQRGSSSLENQVPPRGNQVPPQVQALFIPTFMRDEEIRSGFFTLAQVMTTEAQAVASKSHAMMAEVNQEVGHRVHINLLPFLLT